MTPEWLAIGALFLYIWSHQVLHVYDEHGDRRVLAFSAVLALTAIVMVAAALLGKAAS